MTVELNGIAHIQLTVNDPDRCCAFWEKLCHFFEMKTLIKGEGIVYCIGSRTGVLVRGAPDREQIDAVYEFVRSELDAKIIHAPEEGKNFAPGYYSVLFEDPDGIRIEVNHVPGKGHFDKGGRLGEGGAGPSTGLGRG